MSKYRRAISLFSISILFLFGNQIFATNPKASLICEGNAGPDTLICGYEYVLPSVGDWEIICPENGALVSLQNVNISENPVFTVAECGIYEIVFHDDNGICQDTANISFENPDRRTVGSEFDIDLELEINCLAPPTGCGNMLTMDGTTPPRLDWSVCVSQFCSRLLHTTSATGPIDDCLYNHIDILVDTVNTDGGACSEALITGDNFVSVLGELIQNSSVDCALGSSCFPPPPPNFIPDTTYLSIPVLVGGQWHYLTNENTLVPLMDSTQITIQEIEYLFVIEPGSGYYGPDEIVFTIFEMSSSGEYVPPSTKVDLEIQYVLEYRYELVEFISYIVEPDMELSCSNTTINPGSITIPPGPPNPCGPISLSFSPDKGPEMENGFLSCDQPEVTIETCPGEFTVFNSPGSFDFSCIDENGCTFEKHVEIYEDAISPAVNVTSYECDPGNETYTAEIQVWSSSFAQIEIPGLGEFGVNGSISISGIPSCVELYGYVTDFNNGCYTSFDLYHCCECTNTQSSMDAVFCEGESFEILGQSFTQPGNYEIITTNSAGCDSLINLSLDMFTTTFVYSDEQICEGAEFVFYNQILEEAGEYTHIEINEHGCQELYTLRLEVFKADDILMTDDICEGETYDFFGQQIGESGIYTSNQEDPTGCLRNVILQLDITPIPEFFESTSICEGGSIEIGGELISTAGTFSVINYDNAPCGERYIYDVSLLESSFSSESISLCKGEIFPLNNNTIHSEGIYMDTLTNANGCDSIIQIDVKIDSIDFEVLTNPSCPDSENGSIQITSIQDGAAPYTFSLDGEFSNEEVFENLSFGSYTVEVIDQNLCAHTKQIVVEEIPELIAEIQDAYELTCEEPSLNLALNVDESTDVVWSNGDFGKEIYIDEVGAYSVTLSNSCQDNIIEFLVEEIEDDNTDLVYIPNVFSPNQDNINDEFKILYGTQPVVFQLEIYDRWGNKVFHTNDPEIGWTGMYRNENVHPGVYVYKLEAVVNSCFGNPKSVSKKGDFTLVK